METYGGGAHTEVGGAIAGTMMTIRFAPARGYVVVDDVEDVDGGGGGGGITGCDNTMRL